MGVVALAVLTGLQSMIVVAYPDPITIGGLALVALLFFHALAVVVM